MANDFSGDGNVVALWLLNDGALETDSAGTNTLTNSGVTANTSDKQEGDASGSFVEGDPDEMYIADADLDTDFPLKSSVSTPSFSIGFWFKPTDLANAENDILFSKNGLNRRCFQIFILGGSSSNFSISARIGTTGGFAWETLSQLNNEGSLYDLNQWYHYVVTFNDSTKAWKADIYDLTNTDRDNDSGTATNNINNSDDGELTLGADFDTSSPYDGLLDEVFVTKDILTDDEINYTHLNSYLIVRGGR